MERTHFDALIEGGLIGIAVSSVIIGIWILIELNKIDFVKVIGI